MKLVVLIFMFVLLALAGHVSAKQPDPPFLDCLDKYGNIVVCYPGGLPRHK
uniref:Uncharacterized protein n=4 Tax=gambiae species complex TaxID=44542 RepID=A0A2C9H3W4_ANOGA